MTARLDLAPLRGFFMGVVGWPPEVVRRAALQDLCATLTAHADYHGRRVRPAVDADFMRWMMAQYPDKGKT